MGEVGLGTRGEGEAEAGGREESQKENEEVIGEVGNEFVLNMTFRKTCLFVFSTGPSLHALSYGLSDPSTNLQDTLECHFTESAAMSSMTLSSDTHLTPCFNRNGTSLPTVG